jgi:hypothetical protein
MCYVEFGGKGEKSHSSFADATHVLTVTSYNFCDI